jgi:hypothetical protein
MQSIETNPTIPPAERSMPAVIITMVTPTAMMPITAHSRSSVRMLGAVKKFSLVSPKIRNNSARRPTDVNLRIVSCLNLFLLKVQQFLYIEKRIEKRRYSADAASRVSAGIAVLYR